jgi:hypothetical protein
MSSANSKQLAGADTIDYEQIIQKYPWIIERDRDCILSPDSDGLLCGLLMAHYLGWKIRGFYDGKVLIVEKGISPRDCVFLDMEIFRSGVRSVGQHMVLYNRDHLPENWEQFDTCISGNNVRGFDFKHEFPRKYPFATVHLLMGILGSRMPIDVSLDSIAMLLYSDGTFKNIFNYPDNCLDWLAFWKADDEKSPLHSVFFNDHFTVSGLMWELKDIFAGWRAITGGTRGGDKIKFSNTKGEVVNFDAKQGMFEAKTLEQAEKALELLAKKTGWTYNRTHWSWVDLHTTVFKKGSITPSQGRYDELMKKNPLSLAITGTLSVEYTLDPDNLF